MNPPPPHCARPLLNICLPVLAALLFNLAPCFADDVPPTARNLNYKPGVDQVLTMLRSPDTVQSAERIIRGFPEEALPIAQDDLAHQFSDLPPDVRAEVQRIIDRNHAARAHFKQLADAEAAWSHDLIRDSYQKVGVHNPKWDDDAVAAMLSFVANKPDLNLFQKAEQEGCTDPLFCYFNVRTLRLSDMDKYRASVNDAADTLVRSDYPAIRKCFALLYAVESSFLGDQPKPDFTAEKLQQNRDHLDAALALFPLVCQEPNVPPADLAQMADLMENDYYRCTGDRAKSIDTVFSVVANALPGSTIPLDLKGRVYIDLAWDARGSGWASTVTDNGQRLMQQRLQIARQVFTQACDKDPFDYTAPTQMIGVVLGDGSGQPEMEKWFNKAVEAYPDNQDAYSKRMYFLEPKWYGSQQAMLDFGHECVATQNFGSGIPLELASAHEALSRYYGNGYSSTPQRQYFHDDPSVWPDVCASCVPTLYLFPDDYYVRSLFALYADWCGEYGEAIHQFKLLGDHPDLTVFGSQEQFYELRNEALTQSATTQP
jgi:hypothetical protein